MKYIIYKDAFGYHGTDEKNYNARIQDKSVICDYTDFESAEDIREYLTKYTYIRPSDIVIMEENTPQQIPESQETPHKLCVCSRCLMGIESHEGQQITRKIYLDDDDPRPCDWCEESDFDILYEIQ